MIIKVNLTPNDYAEAMKVAHEIIAAQPYAVLWAIASEMHIVDEDLGSSEYRYRAKMELDRERS